VPLLGDYALRVSGEDYSGRTSYSDVKIRTGSAGFFRDDSPLAPGATLSVGQILRVVLARPFAFTAEAIEATIDGVPAGDLGDYTVVVKDGEGKRWEAALVPTLAGGEHDILVSVSGFKARRHFVYSPVRVDVLADGRSLFENDFVASDASLELVVRSAGGLIAEDIEVTLDDAPQAVTFEPNGPRTEWTGVLGLSGIGLTPGAHTLTVSVKGVGTARSFRISEGLSLLDVSAYPNPFAGAVYFFYTLTEEARDTRLSIYTVSGRKIFEAGAGTFPGYNQCKWDGRDSSGDRVANGTYIYKLVTKGSGGERRAVGRVVKLD
jgi:hypothetical protein